ncbi:MAG: baseplate J/gp47 family protein [Methanobrevibacter boviskoreani]|uniref:baseplate J/gp47 family protein n=1 Tax=Methanobrevibacter boviskoreani TaxID=1348249 RepID=UPI0005950EF1|nr:baseplate J/gp47 family protein [Methanobrevibacter boviskoreani]MCI6931348.1 baseplate J/gp47 family protein [Methanobrevibacter boviskoreani]
MINQSKIEEIASLNFRGKTYNTAFMETMEMLFDEGIISNNEDFKDIVAGNKDIESELVMLMSVICEFLWDKDTGCVSLLRDNYESTILDKAQGIDLEIIADYFGIYRIPATYSAVDVTFEFGSPLPNTVIIPKDVRVATSNSADCIVYKTQEAVTIPAGATEYVINCVSMTPGYAGRVGAGEISVIIDSLNLGVNTTVYNMNASSGGVPRESDDELRTRIRNWAYNIPRTTSSAYSSYLRSLNGIKGARLIPKWNGNGTLKIVVAPGDDYLIRRIQEDVESDICSVDDDVTVVPAKNISVDISVVINTDIDLEIPLSSQAKSTIEDRVYDAICIFIDGGYLRDGTLYNGLGIGEDFIPFQCSDFIKTQVPELKNITFTSPGQSVYVDNEGSFGDNVKGKSYAVIDSEIINIDDTEIADIGNITVKVE